MGCIKDVLKILDALNARVILRVNYDMLLHDVITPHVTTCYYVLLHVITLL